MENKDTFDTVAEEYNKIRPTYPIQLFDDIIQYSKLETTDRTLEIGCGTGQATQGFVNKGYSNITCVELGKNLARITKDKFKDIKNLQVINSTFENYDGGVASYELVISATAFHFIEPEYGYRKVSQLLAKAGSMGFFWTVQVPSNDKLHTEIRQFYRDYAPHLDDSIKGSPQEVIDERKALTEKSGLFNNIMVKEYKWVKAYSSEEYISLLNTHSRHRQLPEHIRKQLFNKIKNAIDHSGGYISKDQLVALFLGRKRNSDY